MANNVEIRLQLIGIDQGITDAIDAMDKLRQSVEKVVQAQAAAQSAKAQAAAQQQTRAVEAQARAYEELKSVMRAVTSGVPLKEFPALSPIVRRDLAVLKALGTEFERTGGTISQAWENAIKSSTRSSESYSRLQRVASELGLTLKDLAKTASQPVSLKLPDLKREMELLDVLRAKLTGIRLEQLPFITPTVKSDINFLKSMAAELERTGGALSAQWLLAATSTSKGAESFARVSNVARQLGMSVEELSRNVGSFKQASEGAVSSMTSLNFVFTRAIPTMALVSVAFKTLDEVLGIFTEQPIVAARFKDITAAFQNMSERMGVSASELTQKMREVSRGTASDMELLQTAIAGMALTEGVLSKDLPTALALVRTAALATGRDVDVLFEKLILGIGRLSPRLIDDLGLSVKLSEAYDRYAQKLGKSADALTAVEQRQALWQETLRVGSVVYGDFTRKVDLNVDAFKRSAVATDRLKRSLGDLAGGAVVPLLNLWTVLASRASEALDPKSATAGFEMAKKAHQELIAASQTYDEYIQKVREYNAVTREAVSKGLKPSYAIIPEGAILEADRFAAQHERVIETVSAVKTALEELRNANIVTTDEVTRGVENVIQTYLDAGMSVQDAVNAAVGAYSTWEGATRNATRAAEDLAQSQSFLNDILKELERLRPEDPINRLGEALLRSGQITPEMIQQFQGLISALQAVGYSADEVLRKLAGTIAVATGETARQMDYFTRSTMRLTTQQLDAIREADIRIAEAQRKELTEASFRALGLLEDQYRAQAQALLRQYGSLQGVQEAIVRGLTVPEEVLVNVRRLYDQQARAFSGYSSRVIQESYRIAEMERDVFDRRLAAQQNYQRNVESAERDFRRRMEELERDFRTDMQRDEEDFQNRRYDELQDAERSLGTETVDAIRAYLADKERLTREGNQEEIARRRNMIAMLYGVDAEALLDRLEAEERDHELRKRRRQEDYEYERHQAQEAYKARLEDLRRALAEQQAEINRAFADRIASLINVLTQEDYELLKQYGPEGMQRITWMKYVDWLESNPAVREVITRYVTQGIPPSGTPEAPQPGGGATPRLGGGAQPEVGGGPLPEVGGGETPPKVNEKTCFSGDTLILTPCGKVRIDSLKVGDAVLIWDGSGCNSSIVTKVLVHESVPVYRAVFYPGVEVLATIEHRFYVPSLDSYIPLAQLAPGMAGALWKAHGLVEAPLISIEACGFILTVYNIEVESPCHNYFANGLLVHNFKPSSIMSQWGWSGIVSTPTAFVAGEAGPEYVNITPYRPTVSLSRLKSSMAGVTQTAPVNISVALTDRQLVTNTTYVVLDNKVVSRSVSRRWSDKARNLSYFTRY